MKATSKFFICTSLVFTLALGLALPAAAELVQSGGITIDPAAVDHTNPPGIVVSTDVELLSNGGFESGSLTPWYIGGGWQISTNGPHTGTYCAYDVGNNWIRQDFAATPAASIVSATLWMRQPEAQISAIDFFYSNGTYSEDLIWLTTSWAQYNVTSFIDPGTTVTGIRIWGYSGGPGGPDETFIDDISVQTSGAPPNVTIDMTPVSPPIMIPLGGGNFQYIADITNLGTTPATFFAWIKVRLPSGALYGPVVGPISMTLPGSGTISKTRTQSVPGSAPAGNYQYIGYVGTTYPMDAILDSSYFAFFKTDSSDGGNVVTSWDNAEAAAPTDFTLNNYPNPFNPTTTISYIVPLSGNANLTVYDLGGRQVEQLINGYHEAGSYQVTFDGAALSSGVYLYRLQNAGQVLNGKMVLMK